MSEKKPRSKYLNPVSITALIFMIGIPTYMFVSTFQFSNEMDDDLYELLTTNQTHVDSLTCDNLQTGIEAAERLTVMKPTKTLPVLKQIAVDKNCDFIGEVKP